MPVTDPAQCTDPFVKREVPSSNPGSPIDPPSGIECPSSDSTPLADGDQVAVVIASEGYVGDILGELRELRANRTIELG